jgi:Flp pilus assembly protein TadD
MLTQHSFNQKLHQAKSLANKGNILGAHQLLKEVLESYDHEITLMQETDFERLQTGDETIDQNFSELLDKVIHLYNAGSFHAAIDEATALLEKYPSSFELWNLLAAGSARLGMLGQAISAYQRIILLRPDYPDAYNNLGNALNESNDHLAAMEALKIALEIKPDFAEAHNNMGNALLDLGRFEDSIISFSQAVKIKPDFVHAYTNMGLAFSWLGKLDEAIRAYKCAIEIDTSAAHAHYNLSLPLLNKGLIQEGLQENEWRWGVHKLREFAQPMWDGKEDLHDKRVLIWAEQGVGDTINWMRYVPLLLSKAKQCKLECQEKLVPLLSRSFPDLQVSATTVTNDEARVDFDLHIPTGSLCKHFNEHFSNMAAARSYLTADPERVEFWKYRLQLMGKGPFIGVSWKSSLVTPSRAENYAEIEDWLPLFHLEDAIFINLQYCDFRNDLDDITNRFGVEVYNFDDLDLQNDLDDVAALCSALDYVVSTKITVPFISAAVGTITKVAAWHESPWNNILYNPLGSSVKIYQRKTGEAWSPVFQCIKHDIANSI